MRLKLWAEFIILFIAVPVALILHPTRLDGHLCLGLISIYALIVLRHTRRFSWRKLWHGAGWSDKHKKQALLRFAAATAAIIIFTCLIMPQRLFSFPLHRPFFWLLVMILYPLLSALPQELVLRSFFFRRYKDLFAGETAMIIMNALVFAFIHVMFHNWISPLLCFIAGGLFSYSYTQHRSLKWAMFEHSLYGCMIFTIGIGGYFLVRGFRP